ncbi:MAG: hypothetical protein AB8G99_26615 [Planctomycetaceae bacterium]
MKWFKGLLCGGLLVLGIFAFGGCGDDGPAEPPENADAAPPANLKMSEENNLLTEE